MHYKRFVFGIIYMTILSAGMIALGNWLIDPYQIWDTEEITHWKFPKPAVEFHQRFSEIQRALKSRPEAVIIGTSRADTGFDPLHSAFKGLRAYNLATQAQPPKEARLILERLPGIKRAVWGTDFFTYGCQHQETIRDFNEELFTERSRWFSLISISTIRDSILTVLMDPSPYQEWNRWRTDGLRSWSDDTAYIKLFGYRRKSLTSERQYLETLYGGIKTIQCASEAGSNPIEEYRRALQIAHERNIDLRLVIGPSHARQWETLAMSGLWPTWESWKRLLVQINEQVARGTITKPFPLWDFSGYNIITTEVFPSITDNKTQMQWYWDSSHFKKETGDLVLSTIFGHRESNPSNVGGFGVLLSSENLESHLAAIRNARSEYRRSNGADVAEIEGLARETQTGSFKAQARQGK